VVHKVSTGFLNGKSVWVNIGNFPAKGLKVVKDMLSQCYNKVNIMVNYSGVEIYLHEFSARALDVDLLLTSVPIRIYQLKKHL
jgi:hypothetical protein